MTSTLSKIAIGGISTIAGIGLATLVLLSHNEEAKTVHAQQALPKSTLPTRDEQIKSLQTECFDIVVIGGGATGAGCALDAATRGLKTALIEADDFSSGTSSRSTKLVHGGVRYLQKAIMQLDIVQYRMVKEALHERTIVLRSAPHLAQPLPIMLPVYSWWQIPYFWIGIKMYDFVAGGSNLKSSYLLSKKGALEKFPMLRGENLWGAVVYYDGQMDDARLNLAIVLTAARYGATVVNHVSVIQLLKKNGVICGVRVRDELSGKTWTIPAKCVINATGPFTDSIRKMDHSEVKKICSPSSGVHVTLPGCYSPQQMGLLDPSTSDGRVIFFLPWQKHTIAGTTDLPCEVSFHPKPTEDEIMFILEEVKNYLNPDVRIHRKDVLSAWSGIRPLVSDPNKPDTQSLARNHIIHISDSKLVTVAGGKWTTYRSMAKDTIDAAIEACCLAPKHTECLTDGLMLEGSNCWTPTMYLKLIKEFGLKCDVAQHLAQSYGDRAFDVVKMAPRTGKKIHPEFPYIEAEVRYGVKEYAMTAIDMIARRLRMAFLDVRASEEALSVVIDIMGEELKWSEDDKEKHCKEATKFLRNEMGGDLLEGDKMTISYSKEDMELIKQFASIDKNGKGYISLSDIERNVSDKNFLKILQENDISVNGHIELTDYLKIMSSVRSSHSSLKQKLENEGLKKTIPVERSGGGV